MPEAVPKSRTRSGTGWSIQRGMQCSLPDVDRQSRRWVSAVSRRGSGSVQRERSQTTKCNTGERAAGGGGGGWGRSDMAEKLSLPLPTASAVALEAIEPRAMAVA